MRVPLGPPRLAKMETLSDGKMMNLHATTILELCAQPIVLQPVPPMLRLLVKGCGCARCDKHKCDYPLTDRGWVLAYDVLLFYIGVLQTSATSSKFCTFDGGANSQALRMLVNQMACVQDGVIYTNRIVDNTHHWYPETSGVVDLWKALDKVLRTDPPEDREAVPPALIELATIMTTHHSAMYTIELLSRLENQIWIRLIAGAPPERKEDLLKYTAFWTDSASVQPVGAVPEADEIVRERSIEQQCKALRYAASGDPEACTFNQWPTVTIPSVEALAALPTGIGYVPLESACYTVLSFYYASLLRAAPRIGAAQPISADAAREQ